MPAPCPSLNENLIPYRPTCSAAVTVMSSGTESGSSIRSPVISSTQPAHAHSERRYLIPKMLLCPSSHDTVSSRGPVFFISTGIIISREPGVLSLESGVWSPNPRSIGICLPFSPFLNPGHESSVSNSEQRQKNWILASLRLLESTSASGRLHTLGTPDSRLATPDSRLSRLTCVSTREGVSR